ncbi:SGNH/GDSL hydrolase family protein [Rhizobium sp. 9140]|uniref:SGNH/GDSL hydrolase family protein n=1 Tax=Rhizobium sp. 9140 TaxID=1761900 RepID=UPI000793225A|nr:SGNH/GDSL hydrolase family protein [Rhizobium sp. 9140]CZT34678.1 Tat (twin-arginine translocation) pathway signal sequence [Rhizobium sp. 9140]
MWTIDRRQFLAAAGIAAAASAVGPRAAWGSPAILLSNIASRGQVPNATGAANGAKTRMKVATRFVVGAGGALSIAPVFSNFSIVNAAEREIDGQVAYTLVKVSASSVGRTVPFFFDDQRSRSVEAGAVEVLPEALSAEAFGLTSFAPGTVVYIRMLVDLEPRGLIAVQGNATYLPGESQVLFNPRHGGDDINEAGWQIPQDSDLWVPAPCAVMLVGTPAQPVTSVAGIGDSLLDGAVDMAGDGQAGGGWGRRAAFAAGLPYLSVTRTGDKAQFVSGNSRKSLALVRRAGATAAIVALGTNDIRDGRTADQVSSDLKTIWSALRAAGVRHIAQATILSETISPDANTTIEGQQSQLGFGAASVVSAVNDAIAAFAAARAPGEDAGHEGPDDILDIVGAVQTNHKWHVPLFETVLAAPVPAWGGALVLRDAPLPGDHLVFLPVAPDGASEGAELNWPHVTTVSATHPVTAVLNGGPGAAHDAGTPVRATLSADGIHPQAAGHVAMAAAASSAFQRIAADAVVSSGRRGIEIDFVNDIARIDGARVALARLLSCKRKTPGFAEGSAGWRTVAAHHPRRVDGGGLLVEPAARNLIRKSGMTDIPAAGGGLPGHWSTLGGDGLRLSVLRTGTEAGISFLDLAWDGVPVTDAVTLFFEEEGAIAVTRDAAADGWTLSCFLARIGGGDAPRPMLGLTELASSGEPLARHSTEVVAGRSLLRQSCTAIVSAPSTTHLRPYLFIPCLVGQANRFAFRIGLPQLEKAFAPSSIIPTTGQAAVRETDEVVIMLPPSLHNMILTYEDASMQEVFGIRGPYTLPPDAGNRRIVRLSARPG